MSGSISLFILNMCTALQIKQKCDIESNEMFWVHRAITLLVYVSWSSDYTCKKYTYHFDVIQYWLLVKNTTRTVKWHRHCAASCDFAFLSLHGNSFHSNYMNQQAATHPFCVITDKLYTNELMWPCNNKIEGNFLPIIQQNVSEFSSAYKNFHKQFILIFLFICAWLVFTDDHFENKLQIHITVQCVLFLSFTSL